MDRRRRRLGFLECRRKPWILIHLMLLIPCTYGSSSFPEFSHRNSSPVSSSVNWSKLRKNYGNAANTSLSCRDYAKWLGNPKIDCDHTHESSTGTGTGTGTGTVQSSGNFGFRCVAAEDHEQRETALRFLIKDCIHVRSTVGTPWEHHLAGLILRERAKGASSIWAAFLGLLPIYVPLPMFFTEMELESIEDSFVTEEITKMRSFVTTSYRALRGERIAHARFSEFAWAMSMVYSMALQHDDFYFLPPMLGSSDQKSNVFFSASIGVLELTTGRPIKKGEPLYARRQASTEVDIFIFQGVIPETSSLNWHTLFKDVNEVSEWYFAHYGGVNTNRYLTTKVAGEALELEQRGEPRPKRQHFSVSSSGEISSSLMSILASLAYASESIRLHNSDHNHGESPVDFNNMRGTPWEKQANLIAEASRLDKVTSSHDGDEALNHAFSFASKAVLKRVSGLLESYTTDVQEDKLLLEAARWEGFDSGSQDLCSSCRFQIEKQSFHDSLATAYLTSKKQALECLLKKDDLRVYHGDEKTDRRSTDGIHKFSMWMKKHGFSISEKTSISLLPDGTRGVAVREDIEEGETICTLPLNTGLFDSSSASTSIADAWDLAAARLLQEKSLGNSSFWASYIDILPRDMASPIYLASEDLHEVQWKPAIRELIQIRKAIRKSYRAFEPSKIAFASFRDYEWAAIMVHSRAFTLPVLPNEKYSHYVLMPYMDMINHHYVYQADWMSQPVIDGKLEIIAKRSLKKGEQLFASFGPRSNDNLFLYYGFVLNDNPFDSAELFTSFKDATRWFVKTWTYNAQMSPSNSPRSSPSATEVWSEVKKAIDDFEGGSGGPSSDWWGLVSKWADFGYQYLPYQPGPTVYSYGVADPSLVAGFEAAASKLPQLHQVEATKLLEKSMREAVLSAGHPCRDHLVGAVLGVEPEMRRGFIARVSVAIRCVEVLASLPTSLSEDRRLLRTRHDRHGKLVLEYRIRKKLLLKAVVERVCS